MLCLAGAWPRCSVCSRRQGDTLFVHSFGLRPHDEAEEVLIWYGGPSDWRRGRSTPLVIQTGALEGIRWKQRVWLWCLSNRMFIILFLTCFFFFCNILWSFVQLISFKVIRILPPDLWLQQTDITPLLMLHRLPVTFSIHFKNIILV